MVGLPDAGPAHHQRAGREVRTRHMLHQLFDGDVVVVDIGAAGVDHLAQVMGRDVGRHADGDAAGAIDQQVGEAGRQNVRLDRQFVVVGMEIDGVLVDIVEQAFRRLGQTRLGVAHRRRRVAVHRSEIALPVDQRQAHGEVLRHADHGVVDRAVAVRMVFTHHVTDDTRRFLVGLVAVVAAFLHRIKDAAMYRFQAVTNVGERAADDHAHRVIEIAAPHLLFDGDRRNVGWRRCQVGGQKSNSGSG